MNGSEKRGCYDWRTRHTKAFVFPKRGLEASMVSMLQSWESHAVSHRERYDSAIGDDYVLGPEWGRIGRALLGLLNGELGRLDGGTLDGWIRNRLTEHGIDGDDD